MAFKIEQTDFPSSTTGSTNGFSSGSTATTSGSFQYQFNSLGTFYYWSGFVDSNGQIALRGVINVQESQDVDLAISVSVGGVQGLCFFIKSSKTLFFRKFSVFVPIFTFLVQF